MVDFVLRFSLRENAEFNPGVVGFPVVFGRLDMFNKLLSAGLVLKRCNISILLVHHSNFFFWRKEQTAQNQSFFILNIKSPPF